MIAVVVLVFGFSSFNTYQRCRNWGGGGAGKSVHPIPAAHPLLLAPQTFFTFRHHCLQFQKWNFVWKYFCYEHRTVTNWLLAYRAVVTFSNPGVLIDCLFLNLQIPGVLWHPLPSTPLLTALTDLLSVYQKLERSGTFSFVENQSKVLTQTMGVFG